MALPYIKALVQCLCEVYNAHIYLHILDLPVKLSLTSHD